MGLVLILGLGSGVLLTSGVQRDQLGIQVGLGLGLELYVAARAAAEVQAHAIAECWVGTEG